jgi:hypothetical protein
MRQCASWQCPKCNLIFRTNNRKLHIDICGTQKIRRPGGHAWSKGKTFQEIYGDRASEVLKKLKNNSGKCYDEKLERLRREKIAKAMVANKNGATSYRRRTLPYKGISFKSSWEVKVARYLDSLSKKWLYEEKSFSLGNNRSYTPDFFVEDEGLFVEVKGYWRPENKQKFDLFQSMFPDIKIEVWNKVKMKELKLI